MSIESSETEYTTLGHHLRQTRIKQDLDLEQVSSETKITIANLKAMEEDNFGSLPAEAFTRGFYNLYAKALSLDPGEVLHSYAQEKPQRPGVEEKTTLPSYKIARQVGSMTGRPAFNSVSCTGLIIIFLLLGGAFWCWYFSWNPATFLSEKLRAFQNPPESVQVSENTTADQATKKPAPAPAAPFNYIVQATFTQKTVVTLKIDNEPKRKFTFSQGETVDWKAKEKMKIVLPPESHAQLSLNGNPVQLSQTGGKDITILIPEYLLDQ